MFDATGHYYEIELVWRQTAPGAWVAVLVDRRTGRRREAHSEDELQAALQSLVEDAADPAEEAASRGGQQNGGSSEA
jgi:hypothetical protein